MVEAGFCKAPALLPCSPLPVVACCLLAVLISCPSNVRLLPNGTAAP